VWRSAWSFVKGDSLQRRSDWQRRDPTPLSFALTNFSTPWPYVLLKNITRRSSSIRVRSECRRFQKPREVHSARLHQSWARWAKNVHQGVLSPVGQWVIKSRRGWLSSRSCLDLEVWCVERRYISFQYLLFVFRSSNWDLQHLLPIVAKTSFGGLVMKARKQYCANL